MNRKLIQRLVSTLMVASFFLATTPHDFIHLFTGHKDTVDHYSPGRTDVSKIHTHCQFLQVNIASYLATDQVHVISLSLSYREIAVVIPETHLCFSPFAFYLRGPPSVS